MYDGIETTFRTRDFASGLEFVNRIGAAAEAADHHPDITLSYSYVHIVLTSHDVGGKLSATSAWPARSARSSRARPRRRPWFRAALGARPRHVGTDEVKPFWQAVLAMTDSAPEELTDSEGDNPTIWFQEAAPDTDQRWHIDLRVPPEVALERIDAALAAGGTIVSTDEAPRFTVLADSQGNKICICTHVGRSR